MKIFKTAIVFFILFFLLYGASSFPADAASDKREIGFLKSLSGGISHDSLGESGYKSLSAEEALKLKLCAGDKIMPAEGSAGEIETNYGASFSFSGVAEMQLLDFSLRINRGGAWVNYKPVKNQKGEYRFKVITPAGTIGIKGTRFHVDAKEHATVIIVTEGVVTFTSNSGEKTEIKAGEKLVVEKGKPLAAVFRASAKELVAAEKAIKKGKNEGGRKPGNAEPTVENIEPPKEIETDELGPNEGTSPFKKND